MFSFIWVVKNPEQKIVNDGHCTYVYCVKYDGLLVSADSAISRRSYPILGHFMRLMLVRFSCQLKSDPCYSDVISNPNSTSFLGSSWFSYLESVGWCCHNSSRSLRHFPPTGRLIFYADSYINLSNMAVSQILKWLMNLSYSLWKWMWQVRVFCAICYLFINIWQMLLVSHWLWHSWSGFQSFFRLCVYKTVNTILSKNYRPYNLTRLAA